ncbi:ATP-binding protein [Pinisolibacter aquiterrae]|uniref:ATP-binding protein n=1 Tax=Pinisolibacter aquiterrae TaxID=2815579 RepID=UPI001C3E667F|nr:HAMP domain-containing histidine kinase [Pinisolibacter aquiterrae]MCC8233345.1 HAMP domain-containing histidine kinase [Pinisolibacter aquiterrae]
MVPLSEAYRLLSNLVSNAVHARAGGGLVEIPLSREGAGIRLAVRVDGAGMDAETRARLDQPGVTTRPVGEGNGLGLGIVSTPGRGTAVSLVFEPPSDEAEVSV